MFKNINYIYANNPGGYCKNKNVRRSLFGLGARCCIIYDDENKICRYRKKLPKPKFKDKHLVDKAKSKAIKSNCRYKISALGFSRKGDLIGAVTNGHRFEKQGGGLHAETELIKKYGKKLKTILICRVGNRGDLLPISPCNNCKKVADKLNIKIISVKE